jgi:hypothetical protein
MDGSGFGCSQPQFWHSIPWGRPPQQHSRAGRLRLKAATLVVRAAACPAAISSSVAEAFQIRSDHPTEIGGRRRRDTKQHEIYPVSHGLVSSAAALRESESQTTKSPKERS